jgi:hypothetical protein
MSLDKHFNLLYDGTTPYNLGDRYYSQDLIRDLLYGFDVSGQLAKRILGNFPAILSGGVVTAGAGSFCLDITEAWGICNFLVYYPDTFASLPPSKTSGDIARMVHAVLQNELDVSSTATCDGVTVNYVKLQYAETAGNTRSRARSSGTYSYEVVPSYAYVVNSTTGTDYDVVLATCTITAAGVVTIVTQYNPQNLAYLCTRSGTAGNLPIFNGTTSGYMLKDSGINFGYSKRITPGEFTLTYTTTTTLTIAAGKILNSTYAYGLKLSSSFIKSLSSWVVGTGNGGLDTGTVAASTTYHVFVILKNSDMSTCDVLFSLSSTAPTMPSGYTYFRRVGCFRTNASSQILSFYQIGNMFRFDAQQPDKTLAALTVTTRLALTVSAPELMIGIFRVGATWNTSSAEQFIIVQATRETDSVPATSNYTLSCAGNNDRDSAEVHIYIDSSRQIAYRGTATTNLQLGIACLGWIDPLL